MLVTLLKTTRPSFLLLPFSVVALAGALAWHNGAEWSPIMQSLVLLGAVCAHASVNVLNEVHDARSGLDDRTQRTPFSGGSGALQKNPNATRSAELLGFGLLLIVVAVGLYFVSLRGWELVPLGLAGIVVIMAYTPAITRSPWLCLLAPGVGFGPLMLVGSYFVLTGEFSWLALAVSLIPMFLVSNLLLLNQFPDLEADHRVGRKHLIIATSPAFGLRVFCWFLIGPFLTLLLLVSMQYLPPKALLGLASLVFALPLYAGLLGDRHQAKVDNRLLGLNVMVNLSMPIFIALGLLL